MNEKEAEIKTFYFFNNASMSSMERGAAAERFSIPSLVTRTSSSIRTPPKPINFFNFSILRNFACSGFYEST